MIQLHVDLAVDPAKEAAMLRHFTTVFRPAAAKFAGYVDVRMLKLRSALMGGAPAGLTYRFSLTYQSEELRRKWATSEVHAGVWGPMEKALSSPNYAVLLFDVE
jgi:phytoene dehydrogenase-like protein